MRLINLITRLTVILTCYCSAEYEFQALRKMFDQCSGREDLIKCLKIKTIKMASRALVLKRLNIVEGVSLVTNERQPRVVRFDFGSNETELQGMASGDLDFILGDRARRFLETHELEIKVPHLIEEGRKKKGGGGGGGAALYWALAIKATLLAMAYNGIAAMSSIAIIVGKMALLLTAILGLKKLVSGGQETTTLEIVKKPKYSESHTYSNSYEEEDDNHHHHHHHRANDRGDFDISKRVFKAYLH